MGTPAFMAPEVLRGRAATTAADIYGFGIVLWEMASGAKPFFGFNVAEVRVGAGQKRCHLIWLCNCLNDVVILLRSSVWVIRDASKISSTGTS